MSNKVSKESYKGVRDFYPEDQFIQNYIFSVWKKTVESFGYDQYDASILELSDLYIAKSGEEIVNDQTYNFNDRGDREVTLRPEMTPTIARMIAKRKRELQFPLRWFSIPNLFRYERPQKGRLREHWQLNVDMFGISSIDAELESIEIAASILRNLGLNDGQFAIRVNNKKLVDKTFDELGLSEIEAHQMRKLLDKKSKIDDFDEQSEKILGKKFEYNPAADETIEALISRLNLRGISNVDFDPTLMRGFDYYTGVVFEIFAKDGENNRSIFGGGRYDDLLDIFDAEKVPAVGFGMGDVVIKDILEKNNLLPKYKPSSAVYICTLNEAMYKSATKLANELRAEGVNTSIDYSGRKVGDQISKASKKSIPYVICIGDDELNSNKFTVKNLVTGKEKVLKRAQIAKFVKDNK
ncbi:MAG: histidyl-tRNA synthetase [Candidatus Paceibacteria bacterium]|jgi:histidyl-tRNA synthetase